MRTLLFLILLLTFWNSFSQEKQFADKEFYLIDSLVLDDLSKSDIKIIDSCLTSYHSTTIDSIKWNALNIIASRVRSRKWYDYQKLATKHTNEKLKEKLTPEERNKLLDNKANNLNNEGYWMSNTGNLHKSIKLYEEAIYILRTLKKEDEIASKLYNLASNYVKIGKLNKAIPLFEEAILIAKKTDNEHTALFIANLAIQYNDLGRTDEAIKFLNEALELDKINSNQIQKAVIYSNLGIISKENTKDFSLSIKYFNQSLSIYQKLNDKRLIAQTKNKIGTTYLLNEPPDTLKALKHLNEALLLSHEVNDKTTTSTIYNTLSKIYFNTNKIDSALYFADKAYELAHQIGSTNNIKRSSLILSKIYSVKKDFKKAYLLHLEYKNTEDNINSNDVNFALAKTEAKLQYEKEKELENIKHQAQIKLKEKEAEKQTLYKRFFIIGSILLIIIMVFILRQFSKSIKQKKTIQKSNLILEEQHREITSSITYAKRIQNAILPPLEHINKELSDSFVYYQPKDIVSGDFYWMEKTKNKLHFAVADCTGHGVPGAMVSVICNNGLNRSVREHQLDTPNEILDKTREIVIKEFEKSGEDIKDGMDISLVSIDFKNNLFEFSGAHNSAWVIRKADESFELIELKGDKQPIGNFERALPFTKKDFSIQKGDILFLSSDGYADQFGGEKNKKIKNTNFKKLLIQNAHLELKKQQSILKTFFEEWKGDNEQLDDVCVVGIKF